MFVFEPADRLVLAGGESKCASPARRKGLYAHQLSTVRRRNATGLGLLQPGQRNLLHDVDYHIHFPAGAVGKDGPSGGIALVSAIVSLLRGQATRADTCMTGEITLSGAVLPVGGVKAKVLAAQRKGLTRVIMPRQNYSRDLDDLPDEVKEAMTFLPVRTVAEAISHVFAEGGRVVLSKL